MGVLRYSEYQMVRYVQLPSLLTPIARALLSALTVSDTADPSGPCSAHVLSLFAARNATIDGPSNERWDSESFAHDFIVVTVE
jgi:hypothetical protein